MTLKMMAAVLAAVLPFAASAQSSVAVYGQVDAALAHEDADAPGVASRPRFMPARPAAGSDSAAPGTWAAA